MAATVKSKDGTKIAYEKVGTGPVVILVLGALNSRKSGASLAKLLASRFTVISYDRRGRGGSTDTAPYAPQREVEDVAALIDEVLDGDARKTAKEYNVRLKKLLKSGRNADAVALFIRLVGVSDKQIQAMRRLPMWRGLEAMAPTLAYDSDVLGEGHSLPTRLLSRVTTPTLVMHGGAGTPSMRDAAQAISKAVPNAQLRTLAGQTHGVRPKVIAPVLADFFE